ncbi:hypothetical protein QQF64_028739 [Cirrhinus molitorella]|uniref:Uncharacterized protein n=1 Tax=Cirrhinus molitorella TaxID=172907 RepID=A0ABR3N7X7_9TELE
MPGALLGLARHRAPSRNSRRKKPPSLHSTVCGQPRDTADAAPPPEPRAGRNITAHRCVKKSLRSNCATEPHPKLELLLPEGDMLLGLMTALSVDPSLVLGIVPPHPPPMIAVQLSSVSPRSISVSARERAGPVGRC